MELIQEFMETVSQNDEARFAELSREDAYIANAVSTAISSVYGKEYPTEQVACMLDAIYDVTGDTLNDADVDEPFSVVEWIEEKLEEVM